MQPGDADARQKRTAWRRPDAAAVLLVLALGLTLAVLIFRAIPRNGLNGERLFPLDDAYIHLSFARGIAAEGRLAFRPGEGVPAVTAPLWTYFLGLGGLLVPRLDGLALGLGAAGYLLVSLLMYLVLVRLLQSRAWGLLGAFCVLVNGRMLWALASGMEITLCAFFILWGFYSSVLDARHERRGWLTAFLLGVAGNLRPEVHLLFLLLVVNRALAIRIVAPGQYRIGRPARAGWLLGALGVYAALQAPYALYCLLHHGRLFPTTYYSKQLASDSIVWPYLGDFVTWLVLTLGPLFLFCLVGWALAFRRSVASPEGRAMLLPALWLLVFPLAQAMKNPAMVNHGRYLMPFIPLWTVLSLVGMKACFEFVRENRWELGWGERSKTLHKAKEALLGLVVLLCILFCTSSALMGQRALRGDYRSMAEWVNTARYVRENLPPEARLAVHDVGVLGYLTPNPLFDLEGLLSPEVAFLRADSRLSPEEKEKRIVQQVRRAASEYLVVHRWYKRRIASLPAELIDEGREGRMMSVWRILPADQAASETES